MRRRGWQLTRWAMAIAHAGLALAGLLFIVTPALAQDDEERLLTVGYRLAVANAAACAQPHPFTGLLFHELGQYAAPDRVAVVRATGMGAGFGILAAAPGSTGARAGLRAGDELLAVNGTDLAAALPPSTARGGSYARMGAFDRLWQEALAAGPVRFGYRRGEVAMETTLTAEQGCGGALVLVRSDELNAWSDGSAIAVTTRLLAAAPDDDALAFVIAHEMAHTLAPGESDGKAAEMAADRAAVGLLQRAGFDATGAMRFLAQFARLRPLDLAIDHPGLARRLRLVAAAAALPPTGAGPHAG